MEITVGGKVITLEYTFEAAERHECIDAAMDIFGGTMTAKIDSTHSEEMQVRDFLMSLSDLPRMARQEKRDNDCGSSRHRRVILNKVTLFYFCIQEVFGWQR